MIRQRQQSSRQGHDISPAPSEPDQSKSYVNDIDGMSWATRNKWVVLAMASGACAAFNGVFAKLTTTELTSTISKSISKFLGLSNIEGTFEFVVRAGFFGLNLVFNGVMWTLFTQALAKGNSTTQVSVINTGSNFIITALLGLVIFSEELPPLWWLGAAFLVVGNVIVGRKDETAGEGAADGGYAPVPQQPALSTEDEEPPRPHGASQEEEEEDIIDLGDLTQHGNVRSIRRQ